jgi:hypothetical protein
MAGKKQFTAGRSNNPQKCGDCQASAKNHIDDMIEVIWVLAMEPLLPILSLIIFAKTVMLGSPIGNATAPEIMRLATSRFWR